MRYWLFKSEPDCFSIDDLFNSPKKTAPWDGVRNYQVRNLLRDVIQKGDLAFFYHSSTKPPGIVGIMEIVTSGYPDTTDPDFNPLNPRWYLVDVRFKEKFQRMISLSELRECPVLSDLSLLKRGNRLSITPVSKTDWNYILRLKN